MRGIWNLDPHPTLDDERRPLPVGRPLRNPRGTRLRARSFAALRMTRKEWETDRVVVCERICAYKHRERSGILRCAQNDTKNDVPEPLRQVTHSSPDRERLIGVVR